MFFLISLVALPFAAKSMLEFNHFFDKELVEPLQKMPSLNIREGHLHYDYFMPFLIKNNQDEVKIIIDTSAELPQINYIYPKWMLLATKDYLYFRAPNLIENMNANLDPQHYATLAFNDIGYDVFNAGSWIESNHLMALKWVVLVLTYPFLVSVLFGLFFSITAFMSMLGGALAYCVFSISLKYKDSCRLMNVASSFGIVFFVLGLNFMGKIPSLGKYMLAAMVLYFIFALLAIKSDYKRMTRA